MITLSEQDYVDVKAKAKREGYLEALGDVAEAVNESFANWGGPQRENFDVIVNFVWDFYEKAKSRAGKEG